MRACVRACVCVCVRACVCVCVCVCVRERERERESMCGAPQSTVVTPFRFSLYTADCRSTNESCPLVKFADGSELVGKMNNDEDALYHKQIGNFVNWCDKFYLYLNVSKTKERCIDFRKN